MPSLRTYRLFISHAWDYSEDYWRVVSFLKEAPNFRWENLSVPQHDPVDDAQLEYELRNQMRDADAFLIIAGMNAAHREWTRPRKLLVGRVSASCEPFALRLSRGCCRPGVALYSTSQASMYTAAAKRVKSEHFAKFREFLWGGASIKRRPTRR